MKILAVGNMWQSGSERADELNICDVLEREGHEVHRYNKFELEKVFDDKPKPDVILTWKGDEFTPHTLSRLRSLNTQAPIFYIQHDLMENNTGSQKWTERDPTLYETSVHLQHAKGSTAYFSKEASWRREYEDAGVHFIYWPEDACPDFYKKVDTTTEDYRHKCQILGLTREFYPVVFTGTWMDMGIDRPEYLKPMRDELDLTIFSLNPDAWQERGYQAQAGMWDDNYAYLISKSKVNLALDWRQDVEGYWSDRIAQIMGAGGFALAKYTLGMERAFGPDKECLVYWDNQQDCIEKAKYYLANEDERNLIAQRGFEYCNLYLKFDYRVRQFLTILRYHFGLK